MKYTRFLSAISMILVFQLSMVLSSSAQQRERNEMFRDCDSCPELVVIDAGEFDRLDHPNPWVRGTRVEKGRAHTVTLTRRFAIGKFEITTAQFQDCVDAEICRPVTDISDMAGANHPVVNVNWHEAQVYVEWLSLETGQSYRLPTESEWEYATRGGQNKKFFTSDSADVLCKVANIAGLETELDWANELCLDNFPETATRGSFDPNAFGLYDVAGNVWEWVEDCYHDSGWEARGQWSNEYQKRTPRDGSAFIGTHAECRTRIMRGGSWRNGGVHVFSPHFRNFDYAIRRYSNLGFRVVREL